MEFELKFAVDRAEILDRIAENPAITERMTEPIRTIPMETTYYDTEDHRLTAQHWTLRRRMEGATPVVTLKTPAPIPGARNEWETEGTDVLSTVPALIALGAPKELENLTAVFPICGAKFTRRAVLLQLEGCTAELALDHGQLFRGSRSIPLCELELELKSGPPAAMFALAKELAAAYSLKEEPLSKFFRASRL